MPGYFLRAADAAEGEKRPVVICTNGYDATMADMYLAQAIDACRRGYHCVLFDGPGQGAMLVRDGVALVPDWERVVTPVVDAVLERDDVDQARIVLQGWSLGGYLAARAATGSTASPPASSTRRAGASSTGCRSWPSIWACRRRPRRRCPRSRTRTRRR